MPPHRKRASSKERELERKRLTFLEYLRREVKYGNITRVRYDKRWKELLTKLALEIIRSDVEYTWHTSDWALDLKDFIINSRMDELKKLEDQSASALEHHNEQIEVFMRQFKDALDYLNDDYLKSLENLTSFHKAQCEEFETNFNNQHRTLGAMLFRMEQSNTEYVKNQLQQHFIHIRSCTDLFTTATNQLEVKLDKKMRKLLSKCHDSFKEYFNINAKMINGVRKRRNAVDVSSKEIDRNFQKIVYLAELLKSSHAKLEFLYDTHGKKLQYIKDDFEEISKIRNTLRDKISSGIALDDAKLKLLISSSITTLNYLNQIIEKGEIVLKLLLCNRKYQTLHEKVLPYPTTITNRRKSYNLDDKLFLFNLRIVNADSSRVSLMEEKKVLQLERLILMEKLKNYCSGYQNCSSEIPKSRGIMKKKVRGNLFRQFKLLTKEDENSLLNFE